MRGRDGVAAGRICNGARDLQRAVRGAGATTQAGGGGRQKLARRVVQVRVGVDDLAGQGRAFLGVLPGLGYDAAEAVFLLARFINGFSISR